MRRAPAWALLDCADDVRLRRLKERGWDTARIDDAMADAEQYRTDFAAEYAVVIRADDGTPTEIAHRILEWAS